MRERGGRPRGGCAGSALALVLALATAASGCPARSGTTEAAAAPSAVPSASASAVASSAVASSSAAPPAASATPSEATTSASPSDPLASVDFRALVAVEAWEHAARAIEALPVEERESLAGRLARTRVAIGRCTKTDGDWAVTTLRALAQEPGAAPLSSLLAELEVDALLCAERFADALAVTGPAALASRKGASAAWVLARALERAGDLAGARVALGRALEGAAGAGLPVGTVLATRLRVSRALASLPQPPPASPSKAELEKAIEADRHRLFVEFPLEFERAVAAGEPSAPPALDEKAWMRRAEAFAALGRGEDALKALDAAASAGAKPRAVARAKGHLLYKARAYAKAAPLLEAASKLAKDELAIQDAFYAARATSRAGDDATAIVAYEALAKKHPKSRFGADAAYLAAHLRWLSGKWSDAIAAFDRYLAGPWSRAPGQESNAREARRARAIALLEAGRPAEARKAFQALLASDEYKSPGLARGRVELLEAIAVERSGDVSGAIARLRKLSAAHPYGFVDLAARARLARLGESMPTWPSGPVARSSPPALPDDVQLLARAGLHRDALRVFERVGLPKDDAARCAVFDAFDAGWEAYKIGLKLALGDAPEASSSWRWRCAHPTPYEPVVAALEKREGLPRGLLHAILRQESGFRVEVVSPAGAVGIAQLMPITAVQTASAIGLTLDPTDIRGLQAPFLQLDLSARHLRALFDELAGPNAPESAKSDAVALVAAAYNAGAGAVKRWLREAGDLDADVFVERTPYLETRGYVARVLGNMVRYAILAGAPPPTFPSKLGTSK